jgi:hypothetical protein
MDFAQAKEWSALYAAQDQVQRIQNEMIGFYGRLEPITSGVTAGEDLPRLQEQLQLTREIKMRINMMQMVWGRLLEDFDKTLNAANAK